MKKEIIITFLLFGAISCRQMSKEEVEIDKWEGTNLEKSLFRAMDYSDLENHSLAIKLCDSIIAIDSTYDRAYFERAMAYLSLDSNKMAIEDFEKVRQMDPKFPGLRDWYARALANEKRYQEAARLKLEELRDYPEGDPGMGVSPEDWTECAEYYHHAGLIDSAVSTLDEYFKSPVRHVSSYKDGETSPLRLYANLLIEKRDLVLAFEKMEQAMKSEYKVPADYVVWTEINILLGNYKEARLTLDYYINEINDGRETDDAKRLKGMMK